MPERPYARYTRGKTWAALYAQHINACYALVPYSATNNSIGVIRCQTPEETATVMQQLIKHADICEDFYSRKIELVEDQDQTASNRTPEQAACFALLKRARHAVILARSSDYYRYHLSDHEELRLVIAGLHDSYLHIPVWEMRTNKRYGSRETALSLTSPDFDHARCTQFGHNILVSALICGDQAALALLKKLPKRTQRRIKSEVAELQEKRYQGRPLQFLTEAERAAIGQKISEGLKRYHARLRVV